MTLSEGAAEAAAPPKHPAVRLAIGVLAAAITLCTLVWTLDLHRSVGLVLYTEQFITAVLGLGIGVVFLQFRLRRQDGGDPPWYDVVTALVGLGICFYLAVDYPRIIDLLSYRPPYLVAMGTILLVLSLEGVRRVIGVPLTLVAIVFVAYAMLGHLLEGQLAGRPVDLSRLMVYLSMDTNAMLGAPLIVGTTVVIPFVLFGVLLSRTGGAEFFNDIAVAAFGRTRGGAAKISVASSALFGTISGSAVANVVAQGVITIPLMKRQGYRGHDAAAIEAVASTGGQLMPPVMGAAAFLMAEFLKVPYSEIVIAAIVPSLLFYGALYFQADLTAGRQGIKRIDAADIPRIATVMAAGWHFLIPFAILIYALFELNSPPELAALYGSAALVVGGSIFGYRGKRLRLRELIPSLSQTGIAVVDLILISAAAGVVIGVLNVSGLSFGLTLALVQVGGSSLLVLLLISAAIAIVLGMGMPTVGVYVLLAALVAPSLVELGVEPLSAHMFVMYFGMMSMITPPVALAAFAAASIAKSEPMRTGVSAVQFGWSAFLVPFLFVMSPTLLFQGSTFDVALAAVTATAGVWLVSVGLAGYLAQRVGIVERLAFGAAGVLLMIPAESFAYAIWTDIVGAALGAALVLWHFARSRRHRSVPTQAA